jgi:hypothetical protein
VNEFDRHPSIRYKDALSLWWDTYCIRVVLAMPSIFKSSYPQNWQVFYENRDEFDKKIIAPDESHRFWRTGTGKGYSYFFTCPNEATNFIDSNIRLISEVHRPARFDAVDALREAQNEDPCFASFKMVVRPKLFFKKYRYCISFNTHTWRIDDVDTAEVDELMGRMFFIDENQNADDPNRVRYKHAQNGKRRIYLRDLNDVVLVKTFISDPQKIIEQIDRIILIEEINSRLEELPLAA